MANDSTNHASVMQPRRTLHDGTWRASELVSTSRGWEEGGAPEEGMEAPGKPLPPDFLALGISPTGLFLELYPL